jgi:hypothetical protein
MDRRKDTVIEATLEQLIEHGAAEMARVFAQAFELAMQIERERFLDAGLYERTHGHLRQHFVLVAVRCHWQSGEPLAADNGDMGESW